MVPSNPWRELWLPWVPRDQASVVEVAKHPIPTTRVAAPVELAVAHLGGERQGVRPTRIMTAARLPGLPHLVRRTHTRIPAKLPHGTRPLGHRTLIPKGQAAEGRRPRGLHLHGLRILMPIMVARQRGVVLPPADRQMVDRLDGIHG